MPPDPQSFDDDLLAWYDRHGRDLPWRIKGAGIHPTPYHVWVSEVMLQQTGVTTVIDYFHRFIDRWPRICDLARASQDDVLSHWAGLGYYARGRNLLKSAKKIMADFDGQLPVEMDDLLSLPGIGPYTAAAIRSIAFDRPATVVDGNIKRVVARLFAIRAPINTSPAKKQVKRYAEQLTPDDRPGDFAESMMDLGAMICTPTSPSCDLCPVRRHCMAVEVGIADQLPVKKKRSKRPEKSGIVYAVFSHDKDQLLLRTRPDHGLLGGMVELPTSKWTTDGQSLDQPPDFIPDDFAVPDWRVKKDPITHVFSHFGLTLTVCIGQMDDIPQMDGHFWHPVSDLSALAIPIVMQKVIEQLNLPAS